MKHRLQPGLLALSHSSPYSRIPFPQVAWHDGLAVGKDGLTQYESQKVDIVVVNGTTVTSGELNRAVYSVTGYSSVGRTVM